MQILVGMYVTTKAVIHQTHVEECHVNKTNLVLGLCMYSAAGTQTIRIVEHSVQRVFKVIAAYLCIYV